ncbi:hypothetical protein [Streptomyces phaeochromogenes]
MTALALAVISAIPFTATPASADPLPLSYIHNSYASEVGIGVVYETSDGGAIYDAILPVDRRTDRHLKWAQAEGYYIGPGYCANSYFWKDGKEHQFDLHATGQLYTPRNLTTMDKDGVARWLVHTFRCS